MQRKLALPHSDQQRNYATGRSPIVILTTNLAAVVCVCAKFDQFLPARFYFESKRPENFVRIAKFPYALPLDRFLRSIVLYFLRETMIYNANRHAPP